MKAFFRYDPETREFRRTDETRPWAAGKEAVGKSQGRPSPGDTGPSQVLLDPAAPRLDYPEAGRVAGSDRPARRRRLSRKEEREARIWRVLMWTTIVVMLLLWSLVMGRRVPKEVKAPPPEPEPFGASGSQLQR
jgi:hypothetical protein